MATATHQTHTSHPSDPDFDPSALPTPPSTRTNAALNLSVLQRHLPSTTDIEFLAPYAVVYICSASTQAWEKSGIEGTLFVVRQEHSLGEGYAVVVLNRRGLENFVVQLRNSEGVDVTGEYIILQGDKEGEVEEGEKVHGLWIFEEEEGSTRGVRRACGEAILQCAERAEKGVAPAADTSVNGRVEERRTGMQANAVQVGEPQQPQSQPTATSTGPDLMALLNASRNQTRLPPAHHNALPQRPNIDHLFRKPAPTTDYPW